MPRYSGSNRWPFGGRGDGLPGASGLWTNFACPLPVGSSWYRDPSGASRSCSSSYQTERIARTFSSSCGDASQRSALRALSDRARRAAAASLPSSTPSCHDQPLSESSLPMRRGESTVRPRRLAAGIQGCASVLAAPPTVDSNQKLAVPPARAIAEYESLCDSTDLLSRVENGFQKRRRKKTQGTQKEDRRCPLTETCGNRAPICDSSGR